MYRKSRFVRARGIKMYPKFCTCIQNLANVSKILQNTKIIRGIKSTRCNFSLCTFSLSACSSCTFSLRAVIFIVHMSIVCIFIVRIFIVRISIVPIIHCAHFHSTCYTSRNAKVKRQIMIDTKGIPGPCETVVKRPRKAKRQILKEFVTSWTLRNGRETLRNNRETSQNAKHQIPRGFLDLVKRSPNVLTRPRNVVRRP